MKSDSEAYSITPLTPFERVCAGLSALFLAAAIIALVSCVAGCVNPNTGTCTVIGEQMALPEITDSSDSIAVRVYESIKGARVWTAKDSVVSVEYANAYTNTYFGIVEMRDSMKLKVKVEPCETDAAAQSAAPCPCKSGGECKCAPGECRCAAASTAAPQ